MKQITFASASVALLFYGAVSVANIDFKSRRVDRDSLLIGTVERGDLDIRISANGVLLPRDLELISAQVEGRVARVHVAPGDEVVTGQVLAELTNPQLVTAAEEAHSEWEGSVADIKGFEVELQNQLLNQESSLLQSQFALERVRLELEAKQRLREEGGIAEIEFLQVSLDVEQLEQTVAIEQKRFRQSKDNTETLLSVRQSKVTQLARALDRANDRVNSLELVAGIDAMVQELDLELGQQLMPGSPVGRLARQELLYAELRVPARQAGDVVVGQEVMIDTRNGTVNGSVSRIDPGVIEGTVIVDVEIHDLLPRGARPQLQIEGIIYVAQIADALHVGRPALIRTDADVSLYKLVDEGGYAERVNVRMGRASVIEVEILEGLEPGDRVILSDSSGWQDQQRILLN
ncbi:MAG: efflux RND transporter periplasmic adaptor subunit [Gammaproteobacteria bacterium]|nr:efflux RND transporter periplasmic adaptor subunit [Gammaproteobacteria bacterium]